MQGHEPEQQQAPQAPDSGPDQHADAKDQSGKPSKDQDGKGDADKGGNDKDSKGKHDQDGQQDQPMDPAKKRKLLLIGGIVGVLVLLLLIAFGVYWWLDGRYLESTDDAYLKADAVVIAPKVSGYVTQVLVGDNQSVKAGQPLLTLDAKQYQAALDMARANVEARRADIDKAQTGDAQLQAGLQQAAAQLASAQVAAAHADSEVARYAPLAAGGADAPEHLAALQTTQQQARASLHQAEAAVRAARQQLAGNKSTIAQARAQLASAQAGVTQARDDLGNTVVASAIDGRVGDKTVQLGQLAQPGTRLMSIVPVQAIYLVANFKETQVGRMRAGQPAGIRVDALPGVKLRGHVESFSPGTGAQFALLQPENATGNFTKIVQRVPVRIAVEAGAHARELLVPGLSVKVEVDTHSGRADLRQIKQESEQDNRAHPAGAGGHG